VQVSQSKQPSSSRPGGNRCLASDCVGLLLDLHPHPSSCRLDAIITNAAPQPYEATFMPPFPSFSSPSTHTHVRTPTGTTHTTSTHHHSSNHRPS
jgi:hypothetical protein